MTEVEIIWPASLEPNRLVEAADLLERGGVPTTCRIQPVRRNPQTTVLILMTTSTLAPFFKALFHQTGVDAQAMLKRFLESLFGRNGDSGAEEAQTGPDAAMFQSAASGAQFLFTPRLPDEALRKALALDPGEDPGTWTWDGQARRWLRVETSR